tara:strand:+ start:16889 stop:17053 length:165 start_codon:yes stop_codon:yes gene_type:complete
MVALNEIYLTENPNLSFREELLDLLGQHIEKLESKANASIEERHKLFRESLKKE